MSRGKKEEKQISSYIYREKQITQERDTEHLFILLTLFLPSPSHFYCFCVTCNDVKTETEHGTLNFRYITNFFLPKPKLHTLF